MVARRGRPPLAKNVTSKPVAPALKREGINMEIPEDIAAKIAAISVRPPSREEEISETVEPHVVSTRPAVREESPRDRAERRSAELRAVRVHEDDDEVDEFKILDGIIPEGWGYEWKTKFVFNQEDTGRMLEYRRQGWEEVPANRHPEMMAKDSDEQFIVRKGMVLMECPATIIADFRLRDLNKARKQMGERQILNKQASDGQFERTGIRQFSSFGAINVPD